MTSICKSEREEDMYLQKFKFAIENCDKEWVKLDMENWSDDMLFLFLRSRNYDVQSALERIQKMISAMRSTHSQVFQDMYPSRLRFALENNGLQVLKNRDSQGRVVSVYRYCFWDPLVISVDDVMRAFFIILLEVMQEKELQQKGVVLIWDVSDFTLTHARYITPTLIRKFAYIINKANPIKIGAIHVMNAPRIFNIIFPLIKFLLSKKVNERIQVHGSSLESLHKHVSPDILPTAYGGNLTEEEAFEDKILANLDTDERNNRYKGLFAGKNV